MAAVNEVNRFEQHAITIICGMLLLLLGWVGFSINQLQQSSARIEERLISVVDIVADQSKQLDRHSQKLIDLQIRIDRVERSLK